MYLPQKYLISLKAHITPQQHNWRNILKLTIPLCSGVEWTKYYGEETTHYHYKEGTIIL